MMDPTKKIKLTVNGQSYEREVSHRFHLADFLRGELGLTGTRSWLRAMVCAGLVR